MSAYKLSLRLRSSALRAEGAAIRHRVAGAGSEPGGFAWVLRRWLSSVLLAAGLGVLAVMPAQADAAEGELRLRFFQPNGLGVLVNSLGVGRYAFG